MIKSAPLRGRPKRPAYQTPLSIVPAKVWHYDGGLPAGRKNEAPAPDRRKKAAARRAQREADRVGQRERDVAQRALGAHTRAFEIIDRLGKVGVDYNRLLRLLEASGAAAWLSKMHLDEIHSLAGASTAGDWGLLDQVRPFIRSMEQTVENEQRRLEAMATPNPLHKRIKAKDREYGGPEGW